MDNILIFFSKILNRLFSKTLPIEAQKPPKTYRKVSREEVKRLIENNGSPIGLDLSYCDFSNINLSNINFGGSWKDATYGTNFEGAKFIDSNLAGCNLDFTNFQNAIVINSDLSNTTLRAANCTNTNFRRSNFRYANLYRTQLAGADFFQADLHLTDLYRAKNLKDASLDKTNFGDHILQEAKFHFEEYLTIHNLGDNAQVLTQRYRRASEIYLHIKNSFTQQGRYQDARWAYLKERRTYRSAISPSQVRENFFDELEQYIKFSWQWWWFHLRFTVKWIVSWMEDFSCGYGELPSRAIFLSIFIIFAFPAIYHLTGGIEGAYTWLDYINYSFGAFTTIGFNKFQAVTPLSQILTSLEAMIGISMLALLVYTLGNRISKS